MKKRSRFKLADMSLREICKAYFDVNDESPCVFITFNSNKVNVGQCGLTDEQVLILLEGVVHLYKNNTSVKPTI
jgi:hypothetical protein